MAGILSTVLQINLHYPVQKVTLSFIQKMEDVTSKTPSLYNFERAFRSSECGGINKMNLFTKSSKEYWRNQ